MKGKTYRSKFAAFVKNVRPEAQIVHPSTGVVINKVPALRAEFGEHGAEYEYTDPDGITQKASDIRGYFFHSGQAQERHGWTDEERETVEASLDALCQRWPEAVWVHSAPHAEKPWASYDETHHKQIPALAQATGSVVAALAYEQENKNRAEVVEKLTELLDTAVDADEAESELTAA